jgi:hypothetical protein
MTRRALISLALLVLGVAIVLIGGHGGRKVPSIAVVPLFVGVWMSIRMLHMAWTDISNRELSNRRRWQLRMSMAFVTPIAGPIYWILRRVERDETDP